jgi:hypothetical protein
MGDHESLSKRSPYPLTRAAKIRHPTAASALARYLHLRRHTIGASDYVFVSPKGHRLPYSTVIQWFLRLARQTGLRSGPGTPGPRIHDLRHTFAVRVLEACLGGGSPSVRICVHYPRTSATSTVGYVLVPARDATTHAGSRRCLRAFPRKRCAMTPIAPHISAFFQKRLAVDLRVSPHTCDTYAYAFQLLFEFMSRKLVGRSDCASTM